MKNIPLDCLALSSLGFSMVHVCFAFFLAASDIRVHKSGHTSSGREVVCCLVSLLPDHVYPSGGLSLIRWILWSLSMHPIIPFHHPCSSNLQYFLQHYIKGWMSRSANVDVLQLSRKCFFLRHVQFDPWYNVMTTNEFFCDRPEVIFRFLIITGWVFSKVVPGTHISGIVPAGFCNLSNIASRNNTEWVYEKPNTRRPVARTKRNRKTNKNEDTEPVRWDLLRDVPEWSEEFTENLVDERVPAFRDTPASSSRESASEPLRKAVSDKHSIYAHFSDYRNCDICMKTKITRAPCRRRIGRVVPRADKFGDLITADHKVLSDNCESRNNHRYAVVVQDWATQWIQLHPCETNTSQETEKSLQKNLEPDRKPKVIYTDISFGIWQGLWRPILELVYVNTSPFGD